MEVAENTATNSNIGDPIAAVDPEDGDVTYSLTGASAGLFDVDASSGQVKTKGSLNYEAASTYTVAFTASDPQSNSASIALDHRRNRCRHRGAGQTCESRPSSRIPGNGHDALKVAWTAPENAGPAITELCRAVPGRGLRMTNGTQVTVGRKHCLETTDFRCLSPVLQVRSRRYVQINDEGEGPWSEVRQGRDAMP